jgi:hypothetical protein
MYYKKNDIWSNKTFEIFCKCLTKDTFYVLTKIKKKFSFIKIIDLYIFFS